MPSIPPPAPSDMPISQDPKPGFMFIRTLHGYQANDAWLLIVMRCACFGC
jgi:hypothetical protein